LGRAIAKNSAESAFQPLVPVSDRCDFDKEIDHLGQFVAIRNRWVAPWGGMGDGSAADR
jgi:hypothetical protein